jgi:hypothetical protein
VIILPKIATQIKQPNTSALLGDVATVWAIMAHAKFRFRIYGLFHISYSFVGLFHLFEVQHRLEEIIGVQKADLIQKGAIHTALREHILSEAVNVA